MSESVQGDISGKAVASASGMGWINVSMPLWGEAHLVGGRPLVAVTFVALGWLLRSTGDHGNDSLFGILVQAPTAALLFIVLRGSLYEVLGYLILALALGWYLAHGRSISSHQGETGVPTSPRLTTY